jgi:hypothetical protein
MTEVTGSELKRVLDDTYKKTSDIVKNGNDHISFDGSGQHTHKLDMDLSTDRHKVYAPIDGLKHKPIIAYRGTANKRKDVVSDIALAFGLEKHNKRFKNSKKVNEQVKKKYQTDSNILVGHSLGGSLAEKSKKAADKVITYNKGAGLGDIGKKIGKNQLDIRHKNDLVSLLANTQKSRKIQLRSKSNGLLDNHRIRHIEKSIRKKIKL